MAKNSGASTRMMIDLRCPACNAPLKGEQEVIHADKLPRVGSSCKHCKTPIKPVAASGDDPAHWIVEPIHYMTPGSPAPCGDDSKGRRCSPEWDGVTCEGCLATTKGSAKPKPGKLQRAAHIKALVESQSFAQQAIYMFNCAAMVEALGGSLEPKRSVSTAVRVVRRVAEAVLSDARSIAAEAGTTLPSDVEEAIRKARRGAEARLAPEAEVGEVKLGAYLVLASVGNPDHRQDPDRPLPGVEDKKVEVKTLREASQIARDWIEENDLGGGNWSGGQVVVDGVPAFYVGYNGAVWKLPPGRDHPRFDGSDTRADGAALDTPLTGGRS